MNIGQFSRRYQTIGSEAARRVQADVFGGHFRVSGYTTPEQADMLAHALRLGSLSRLLDIGAGAGWPGQYLAAKTGCHVMLTDVPLTGIRKAAANAADQRIGSRCTFALASGQQLPFRPRLFDAVVQADTL